MLDEELAIKVLIGIIIALIFGYFLMYFSFERESIMCPYCQHIYKIKYATEVGGAPLRPATSMIMMRGK